MKNPLILFSLLHIFAISAYAQVNIKSLKDLLEIEIHLSEENSGTNKEYGVLTFSKEARDNSELIYAHLTVVPAEERRHLDFLPQSKMRYRSRVYTYCESQYDDDSSFCADTGIFNFQGTATIFVAGSNTGRWIKRSLNLDWSNKTKTSFEYFSYDGEGDYKQSKDLTVKYKNVSHRCSDIVVPRLGN